VILSHKRERRRWTRATGLEISIGRSLTSTDGCRLKSGNGRVKYRPTGGSASKDRDERGQDDEAGEAQGRKDQDAARRPGHDVHPCGGSEETVRVHVTGAGDTCRPASSWVVSAQRTHGMRSKTDRSHALSRSAGRRYLTDTVCYFDSGRT
jgi:hypothetical protein